MFLRAGGIAAARRQRGQGGVPRHLLQRGRQRGQVHGRRQRLAAGGVENFAVADDQRQRLQAQAVRPERVEIPLDAAHAPQERLQRQRDLIQARLVVAVLLLKMLRPQEQALAPQHLGWNGHANSFLPTVLH